MGFSAKTGKNFFQWSQEHFLHKSAIWNRTPPPTHQMQSTCVQEGSRVPNLQTEFNYLDSFKSYGMFSDFVVPTWSPCHPHRPHIILVVCTLSLLSPCCPHIVPITPRRSPWLWSPWSPPHVVPVVPVVPTWSPSSPCHPSSPTPQIPTPPTSTPWELGGPESVKML